MGSIAIKLEQLGIPTVATVVERHTARFMGAVMSQGYIDYPAMFFNESDTMTVEGVEAAAESAVDFVVYGLTEWEPQLMQKDETGKIWQPVAETLTYEGADYAEVLEAFNESFLTEYQWGDGLPLKPPTQEAVEALMATVPYTPTFVVGNWGPAFADFTIEKIAVNAAMAGAQPEHMPVIVAAMQAITSVKWDNYYAVMKSAVPLVVVNGPIIEQLNLNSSANVFGPSALHSANAVIGRAIMMSMRNIGNNGKGMEPSNLAGNPAAFAGMVVAEAEDILALAGEGWEPLNVQLGAEPGTNTVTVLGIDQMNFSISGGVKNAAAYVAPDKGIWPSTAEAFAARTAGVLVLTPMYVITEGMEGDMTKADFQQEMYDNARIPVEKFKELVLMDEAGAPVEPNAFVKELLEGLEEGEGVPVAAAPDKFLIVATGGL